MDGYTQTTNTVIGTLDNWWAGSDAWKTGWNGVDLVYFDKLDLAPKQVNSVRDEFNFKSVIGEIMTGLQADTVSRIVEAGTSSVEQWTMVANFCVDRHQTVQTVIYGKPTALPIECLAKILVVLSISKS